MKTPLTIIFWAIGVFGCLDLELLDEMSPLDAGNGNSAEQGDDEDGDGNGDTEDTDDPGGPPVEDPGDTVAPSLLAAECASSEQAIGQICVAQGPVSASLRFSTNEPASVRFASDEGLRGGVLSEEWATAHHMVMADLDSETETLAKIEIEDVNENKSVIEVPLIGQGGPPVAITEVLADPFGPEPAQEFVEIANLSYDPVDLSGWSVDDCNDANGDVFPDGTVLASKQTGIIVSSSYDASEGQDPPPESTALIIRLEGSIGSNGLKNSEAESIELYNKQGVVISRYQCQAGAPVEGAGAVRIMAELPDGDPLGFAIDPNGTSTPGQAETLP